MIIQSILEPAMTAIPRLADHRRGGLPPWTYFSADLLEVEKEALFRNHWQLACHVSDVAGPGDWLSFDIVGERALIMRGRDGAVRAFHNVCRHRGSRVAAGERGSCKSALVCPFHGWSYNLDGTLRAVPQAKTFPKLDPVEHGLTALEHEIWNGFVFVRFKPGPQPSVATLMAPFAAELDGFGMADYVGMTGISNDHLPVNWKAVRDVDNEGYHVPVAHPALHELYGRAYRDGGLVDGVARSEGRITGNAPGYWSVRNYLKHRPQNADLPAESRNSWIYFGLFPNLVIMVYPEVIGFYQEIPVAVDKTIQRLAYYQPGGGTRAEKAARYLALRIDRMTGAEDVELIKWSWESMQSSGFKGLILSDLEAGVRDWHDKYREMVPGVVSGR
jgi:phenylpropionate dioxygenase-like ring-hydroxylating dioxygenase large terminal subunit